jgi:hypothetical protein
MSIEYWGTDSESWDRLTIGKDVLPGLWTVGYSLEREIDIKKAGGVDGARFKDKGYKPTEITLTGRMSTVDEWLRLQELFPTIHPKRKGSGRSTFAIGHPVTRLAGIQFVYIHKIDAPELSQGGMLTIVITCLEFVPAPKKVAKPAPPVSPTSGGVTDTPPDALKPFPGFRNYVLDDQLDVL